jgi:hypothetical protein
MNPSNKKEKSFIVKPVLQLLDLITVVDFLFLRA